MCVALKDKMCWNTTSCLCLLHESFYFIPYYFVLSWLPTEIIWTRLCNSNWTRNKSHIYSSLKKLKIFVESFEIWLREAIKKEISLKLENFFLLPFFLILLPYWNQLLIRGECWSHAPATDQGRSWVWSWEWGDCPQEVVWRRYHQLTLDIRVSNRWSSSDLLNIFQPSSMSQLLYTSWF